MKTAKIVVDKVIDGFCINYAPLEEHVYQSLEEVCLQILLLSGGSDNLEIAKVSLRDVHLLKVVTIATERVAVHKNKDGEVAVMPIHRIPIHSGEWIYKPIGLAAKDLEVLLSIEESHTEVKEVFGKTF